MLRIEVVANLFLDVEVFDEGAGEEVVPAPHDRLDQDEEKVVRSVAGQAGKIVQNQGKHYQREEHDAANNLNCIQILTIIQYVFSL